MPFSNNGGHLGFQGFRMLKNVTLICMSLLYDLTKYSEILLLPKNDTKLFYMTNEPTL